MTGHRSRIVDRTASQPIIGRTFFAAMSAVEGLRLDSAGMKRVSADKTISERRADILRAYARDMPNQ